jgi:hypothetical protein
LAGNGGGAGNLSGVEITTVNSSGLASGSANLHLRSASVQAKVSALDSFGEASAYFTGVQANTAFGREVGEGEGEAVLFGSVMTSGTGTLNGLGIQTIFQRNERTLLINAQVRKLTIKQQNRTWVLN